MITVSTVSPDEAAVAARVLGSYLPRHVGFEVYLRGRGFAERQPLPGQPPGEWPGEWPQPPEVR